MPDRSQLIEQYRRLQSVTDVALSHLDLDELLGQLLVRVRDTLDADTCAVLMLDEETNELVARARSVSRKRSSRGCASPWARDLPAASQRAGTPCSCPTSITPMC